MSEAQKNRGGRPKKNAGKRTRNWTFIVYPDSAPENWRHILNAEHVPWIESPLHEGETNPDSEAEKKPHTHVMVVYESVKSFEQVKLLTDKINAPQPQMVASAPSLVRYMAHLDHPDKKQYDPKDIKGHGGADVAMYLRPNSSTRYQLIKEMMEFIKDRNITEMRELLDYAGAERFDDWFPLLCDNSAYIIGEYIKSCRHQAHGMR